MPVVGVNPVYRYPAPVKLSGTVAEWSGQVDAH